MKRSVLNRVPGLALIGVLTGIAFLINSFQPAISPLALCVALGFIVANFSVWPDWAAPANNFASKRLLRIGIALLGAQVSIASLRAIGLKGLLTVLVVVIFTIFGILLLSKLFGMTGDLGLLIGIGFGICGATAVAAIRPQTRATEEETSYAIALISLCGTLSIVVLPFLGHLMHLSDRTFGAWAGAAVHDVGQVVATASVWSPAAISAAIVIKLSRVCLLAPIVLTLSFRHRKYLKSQGKSENASARIPFIPFFVLGFIAVAILQNVLTVPTHVHDDLVLASKILIGAGLVALGSGVRWKSIRSIGPRPLFMGMIAWVIVAGVSLAAVRISGM
ncbi:MAG: putative sulfate exporter family transporter [Actinobacteria bacterium]|nr:putative sulfate exporter family transporter [Actinomycetota bacterium]